MVTEQEIMEGLDEWLENPHWKAYYEDAPSDQCRKLIAMEFYYSDTEDDSVLGQMEEIEKALSVADLEHLVKYAGNTPRKGKLMQRIAELKS